MRLRLGVFEQAVDGGDGGVGLARAGGHLDQGAGAVGLERVFQIGDGGFLAIAQPEFRAGSWPGLSAGYACKRSRRLTPWASHRGEFPGDGS